MKDLWCSAGNPKNCACWDLVRRRGDVTGYELEKLDHLSLLGFQVLAEECLYSSLSASPFGPEDCVPLPLTGSLWFSPVRLNDPYEGLGEANPQWPIPIESSPYGLALHISEWVEDEPDEKLRDVLRADSRYEFLKAEFCSDGVLEELEYSNGAPDWYASSVGLGPALRVLARWGLPQSLTTALFFLGEFGPLEIGRIGKLQSRSFPQSPARGLQVHSYGLLPADEAASEGIMIHSTEGLGSWSTDNLERRATVAATRHAAWWKTLPDLKLGRTDLRRFNGRRSDELAKFISQRLEEELSQKELLEKAYEFYEATTSIDKRNVRRKVNTRLSRERTRIGSDHIRRLRD